MITITTYHFLQQSLVLGIDTCQTILVNDKDALTVTDIKQCRCHWVMR